MGDELFFESVAFLEPKCPECKIKIDYGVTTKYDEGEEAHKCLNCGFIIR